jgi:hypothetical protein
MAPAEAARQLLKLAPFAGDKPIPNTTVPAAGFRLQLPERPASAESSRPAERVPAVELPSRVREFASGVRS